LIAVSHSEDFKTFGSNPVLELIMTDIQKLESEGICVDQQLIIGGIAQCIGDNLGFIKFLDYSRSIVLYFDKYWFTKNDFF
jgi:hypothetical protein